MYSEIKLSNAYGTNHNIIHDKNLKRYLQQKESNIVCNFMKSFMFLSSIG